MRRQENLSGLLTSRLLLALGTVLCASTAAAQDEAKLDPQALEVIRRLADELPSLQAFRAEISTEFHMEFGDQTREGAFLHDFVLQRPNRLAVRPKRSARGTYFVSDGARIHAVVGDGDSYVEESAPDTLADLPLETLVDGANFIIFQLLFRPDPFDQLMEGVDELLYESRELFGVVPCHHVRFVQSDLVADLWIEAGEVPLIRELKLAISQTVGQGPRARSMKVVYAVQFNAWDLDPELSDSDFEFIPPDGARRFGSFAEALGGVQSSAQTEAKPHPLIGKDAPTFRLSSLDGDAVDIGAHLGKDVVILDFWATWCGPCVETLPAVAAIAEHAGGRGIVRYSINLREKPTKIRRFLARHRIDAPVLLDVEGKVADLYTAEAIPQTVLIGQDGVVKTVQIGFTPKVQEVLEFTLNELVH